MVPILYEHSDFIIVDKPAGLAVQLGAGVNISIIEVIERDYGFKPFLVHRLDKDTAGCLILAKTAKAANKLSLIMENKLAKKIYRACVKGKMENSRGAFDSDVKAHGKSVSASTYYTCIKNYDTFSYVEIELGTGRMHQIRQHFAQASHPLLGDDKYGDFALNKSLAKSHGVKKILLYASSLHIFADYEIKAEASMPPHFFSFIERWESSL